MSTAERPGRPPRRRIMPSPHPAPLPEARFNPGGFLDGFRQAGGRMDSAWAAGQLACHAAGAALVRGQAVRLALRAENRLAQRYGGPAALLSERVPLMPNDCRQYAEWPFRAAVGPRRPDGTRLRASFMRGRRFRPAARRTGLVLTGRVPYDEAETGDGGKPRGAAGFRPVFGTAFRGPACGEGGPSRGGRDPSRHV